MNGKPVFTVEGAWTGGHYELLIDVGAGVPVPERMGTVAAALWSHPHLEGPYPRGDLEPGEQVRSDPAMGRQYGIANVTKEARVPCATYTMSSSPEFLPDGEPYPPDLLIFYMPLEPLQRRVWREIGGFPFQANQDTRPWQEPLEEWFASIAAHIYTRAPFNLAVTDFEPDVDYDLWRSWADGAVPVAAERRFDLHLGSGADLKRFRRTLWR